MRNLFHFSLSQQKKNLRVRACLPARSANRSLARSSCSSEEVDRLLLQLASIARIHAMHEIDILHTIVKHFGPDFGLAPAISGSRSWTIHGPDVSCRRNRDPVARSFGFTQQRPTNVYRYCFWQQR